MKVKIKKNNPDSYQLALNYYLDRHGVASVKAIARAGNTTQKQVRLWMKRDDWEKKFKGEEPGDITRLSDHVKEELKKGSDFGLNDKEELFCFHYLKTFNITASAIRAGYSSSTGHEYGHRLMRDPRVLAFLDHIKSIRNAELLFDNSRVIQEYMKIAFADMNDFVDISSRGIRPKTNLDGQVVTKIKEDREGNISIQLADKMKALEKLEKYFAIMPQDIKSDIENKRLELLEVELKIKQSQLDEENGDGVADDGFLEALNKKSKEVWKKDEKAT